MALEKILESLLDCKEIKPVSPKGNQFWIFIGRTDAEVATPILWPPDAKIWLIGKDLMQAKTEGKKRSGWQRIRQIVSPTQWRWVWAISERCWRTGKLGMLQSMGVQWVRHNTNWTTTRTHVGFPGGSDCHKSACKAGDPGLIPGLGKSPGEGNGYPLQYSCMENFMNRTAWQAIVHGVTKSQTQLMD